MWALGAFAFIYLWPRITVSGFKRAIVTRVRRRPDPRQHAVRRAEQLLRIGIDGSLMATGTDDVLYVAGWLDLKDGPQVLHVPDMAGRYYSVQFTDPSSGANFAYVGKRTTGTGPGDFLLCEPGWNGDRPDGMTRIEVPHRAALVIGRVFVADERDRPIAYALAKQIQLAPLG